MISVSDPISNNGNALPENCKAINNGNLEYPYAPFLEGMSQKGAIRWSLGDQCTAGGNDSTKWSVTWTDYRQILVHYYTGIDILNASGGKVAPDDRWNLLSHDNFGNPIGTVPQLVSGTSYSIELNIQNTSTSDWNPHDIEIGYQWVPLDAQGNQISVNRQMIVILRESKNLL